VGRNVLKQSANFVTYKQKVDAEVGIPKIQNTPQKKDCWIGVSIIYRANADRRDEKANDFWVRQFQPFTS
jgi:hypothetical protein